MANVEKEPLQTLRCDISEKAVQDADKAAALHRVSKKEGSALPVRPTLSVWAARVKRRKNTRVPFGKFAKDNKVAAEGSGNDRTIAGEKGYIFLHTDDAFCLQFDGVRADAPRVRAVVETTGAPPISANRLVTHHEGRVGEQEIGDDDGNTRIEEIYELQEFISEELRAQPLRVMLTFDPEIDTQVQAVFKLAGIEKIKRVLSETARTASAASLAKARETRAQKLAVQVPQFEASYA
jgi:hypothetical protein